MNTFCANCGQKMTGDDKFCPGCGEAIKNEVTDNNMLSTDNLPKTANVNDTNTKIGMIAVGAVVLIVIAIIASMFSGKPESVVKNYINYSMELNSKKVVDLFQDDIIDAALKEEGITKEYFIDLLDKQFYAMADDIASVLDVSTRKLSSYISIEDVSEEEVSERKIDSVIDDYEEIADIKVKDYKLFEVKIKFEFEDETMTQYMDIPVVKIGSKWYIDFITMQ